MDPGKLTSLVHWVNSVGVGPCVESLQQLQDGSHFIGIIKIINGDRGTQFCDVPFQRYRLVCSFLEDFYGVSLQRHLDHTKILQHADIEELGKVTALLLSAAVQGPKVNFFVDIITKLDMMAQTHLKEIIEVIVTRGGECGILRSNFSSVLYKKLNEEVCSSSPVEPCTPLLTSNKNPMAANFSPVKALFDTPNMVTKMREKRVLYDKIRKLETTLANEKAVRSDQEAEIQEKSGVIIERDAKIKELSQRVSNLRKQCIDIDNMRTAQNQLQLSQTHIARLERRLSEFEAMRGQNINLNKQVDRFVNANNDLESKLRSFNGLKTDHDKLKAQLLASQQNLHQYHAVNEQLQNDLAMIRGACTETEAALNQQRELTDEKTARIKELEEQHIAGKTVFSGETLNIVPERRLGEIESELQAVKASWVPPSTHQKEIERFARQLTEKNVEVQKLKDEVSNLQVALEDSRRLGGQLSTELGSAQRHVSESGAENQQLKEDVYKLQLALEESRRLGGQLSSDLGSAQQQISESGEEIQRLKEEALMLKQTSEDLKKVEASRLEELNSAQLQLTESRNEIQYLKEEAQGLKQNLDDLKRVEACHLEELSSAQLQMTEGRKENQRLRLTIQELKQTLEELEACRSQEHNSAELQIIGSRSEIQRLKEESLKVQQALEDSKILERCHVEELKSAQLQLEESREETQRLKEGTLELKQTLKAVNTSREQEQNSAKLQMVKKRDEIERLKKEISKLQQTLQDSRILESHRLEELKSAQLEVTKSKEEIQQSEQKTQELKRSVEDLETEEVRHLEGLKSAQLQVTKSKDEIRRLKKDNVELRGSLEVSKSVEAHCLEELSSAQLEMVQLNEEIANLKMAKDENMSKTREELEMLVQEVTIAKQQAEQRQEIISTLEVQLKTENGHKSLADDKMLQQVRLIQELQSTQQQHMREVSELQKTNKRQLDYLGMADGKVKQHVQAIKELQTTKEQLKDEISTRQDEIARKTALIEEKDQKHHQALQDAASTKKIVSDLQKKLEKEQRSHKADVHSLKKENQTKTEELNHVQARMRFETDSNQKELRILQEELDYTKRLLELQPNNAVPPLMAEPLMGDVSMDSLDEELNLAELVPGSRDSICSTRSTESNKSQCTYTIEIHSRQSMCSNESLKLSSSQLSTSQKSLAGSQRSLASSQSLTSSQRRLSTNSNLSDSLNLSHLGPLSFSRASNLGNDNLPESVSQTIDELSTDQTKTQSLRASMRQSKISRRTTGRAGFCLIGACEEEPETFDWDRLSELQRRNTLCMPHLQTSYPVETQTRAPQDFSEDGLKLGMTKENSDEEHKTRTLRKRKSGDLEPLKDIAPPKIKTSNSYHAMPPPPPPTANTKRSASHQNLKSTTTISQPLKSTGALKKASTTSLNSINSTASSSGSSSQFERPGILTSSTKSNKTQKSLGGTKASAVKASTTSLNSISSSASSTSTSSNSSQFKRPGILTSSTQSNKSQKSLAGKKAVKTPKKADNRRDSMAFSIGFSPKPQFKRRSNRLSLIKKATNSPKVQAASPGITPRKSKRRSIAKWLGK